ncbi:MAG: 5-bromo-4-chloroindolyl phosphate hydrolysis family protein [Bifidobacteriaceae bacterium]|jgi:5-bromo-4-chloroindolyl phosphate hydrolysis protein/membrane protein implicated in regulation of membrane protease activity|nr:5-bromo-4-chloroindolyl phosphate hydrolysis family protein [Bifidobacteriaceae bacterium]
MRGSSGKGTPRYRAPKLPTAKKNARNKLLISLLIVAGVVVLGSLRLFAGLDTAGQIYATIFILLCAVAYQVVSRSVRDANTTRKYDPDALYESEVTALRQEGKEYSQEQVARFVKAQFTQSDVETFQKNLTEASETVLTWEFAVRQSGYLTLIEAATHGLDSAKKIIDDIRQHPRKMLKYGDFLYTALPNVSTVSVEFLDLTQNQREAQQATLTLIKKQSEEIAQMYESVQLADVQEAVRESGASFVGSSMAESLAHMKSQTEAEETPVDAEFTKVQQTLADANADGTPFGALKSGPSQSRDELHQQERTVDTLAVALVLGGLGAVWTPSFFAIFCGVAAIAAMLFAVFSSFRVLRVFTWLMVASVVVLSAVTFVGYAQQVQRNAVAHSLGKGDETRLTVEEQMAAVSTDKAKAWTMEDFMALDINDTSGYGGTGLLDVLRVHGAPIGGVWGEIGGTRQMEYPQNPRTYNFTEANVDFSVVDGNLIDKMEDGLGTQLPFNWTSEECDSYATLGTAKSWKNAVSFAQITAKHGDPSHVEVTRQQDNSVSFYTTYYSDIDFDDSTKTVSLGYTKTAPDDYRLTSCSTSNF